MKRKKAVSTTRFLPIFTPPAYYDAESVAALGRQVRIDDLEERFDIASLKIARGIMKKIGDGIDALKFATTSDNVVLYTRDLV